MIRGALVLTTGVVAGFYVGYVWHELQRDPDFQDVVESASNALSNARRTAPPSEGAGETSDNINTPDTPEGENAQ